MGWCQRKVAAKIYIEDEELCRAKVSEGVAAETLRKWSQAFTATVSQYLYKMKTLRTHAVESIDEVIYLYTSTQALSVESA